MKKIIAGIIIVVAGWWLMGKVHLFPSLTNIFKPKEVTIEKTPVIIKQIKAIAQLVTISAYDEIVVDSTAQPNSRTIIPFHLPLLNPEKSIVLIGKTTTHIGIDMEKLTNKDIAVSNDSIHIYLPQAEVLDVILNPSDVEIFIEKGDWNNDAITHLKNKIRFIAGADVKSKGLLMQSENKARELFTNFFKAAGYRAVAIAFKS